MGIFDGAGIHGTDDDRLDRHAPPRTAASACTIPDVMTSTTACPVGAPVYIA